MLTPCHPNPRSSPSSSSSSPLVGRSSDHSPYVRNDTWSVTSSDKRPPAPPAAAAPIWGGLCYFNTTKLAVTVAGVIYIWKQISMFTGSLGASWLVLVNGFFLVFVALCMCTRTLNEILLLDFRGRLKTWPLPLQQLLVVMVIYRELWDICLLGEKFDEFIKEWLVVSFRGY